MNTPDNSRPLRPQRQPNTGLAESPNAPPYCSMIDEQTVCPKPKGATRLNGLFGSKRGRGAFWARVLLGQTGLRRARNGSYGASKRFTTARLSDRRYRRRNIH